MRCSVIHSNEQRTGEGLGIRRSKAGLTVYNTECWTAGDSTSILSAAAQLQPSAQVVHAVNLESSVFERDMLLELNLWSIATLEVAFWYQFIRELLMT